MSAYSISTIPYISCEELAQLIRTKNPGVAVIDVRGDDFIGGHILGCQHVPVHEHEYRMPELVRTLKDFDMVVFHCALSQQRGPSSALKYLRTREGMVENGRVEARKDGKALTEGQKVYVLEGGFLKWQEAYGDDAELTQGYVKALWDEY